MAKFNNSTPAHPLVAGFPIEHALRHVANNPISSDHAKNLAVAVLKGHTEGLWGLHDELQDTNHPILKAGYKWLNAADKLHLDKHTYTALNEAAERHRGMYPHAEHRNHGDEYRWEYTPENQAVRAGLGITSSPNSISGQHYQTVMNRVQQLSPHSTPEEVTESIRRHAHRGSAEAQRRVTGDSPDSAVRDGRGMNHPSDNPKTDAFSTKNELATRYKGKGVPKRYSARPDQIQQMMSDLQKPEHAEHTAGLDNPLGGLRGVLADALDEHGRGGESFTLRTPNQHIQIHDGKVLPHTMEHQPWEHGDSREQFTKPTHDGPIEHGDHSFTYWFAQHNPSNNTWYWNPADGDAFHPSEFHRYVHNFDDMIPTEAMPQHDDIFSKMTPSEVAWMRHHARTPEFKLSRKAKKYSLANKSNFIGSLLKASSPEHKMFVSRTKQLAHKMGAQQTKEFAAIHDTPNQSVPGVAMAIYGNIQPDAAHALGSWVNGLLPNGPGYAVFHARPTGPDTLYRIRMEGSGYDARMKLDRAGISSRIFVPHKKGLDVLVPDKGNQMGQAVQAFSQQQKVPVESSPGHLTTIGSQDQGQARDTFRNKVVAHESKPAQFTKTNARNWASNDNTQPSDDVKEILNQHIKEPSDKTTHGVLLDKIMEDHNVTRSKARALRLKWLSEEKTRRSHPDYIDHNKKMSRRGRPLTYTINVDAPWKSRPRPKDQRVGKSGKGDENGLNQLPTVTKRPTPPPLPAWYAPPYNIQRQAEENLRGGQSPPSAKEVPYQPGMQPPITKLPKGVRSKQWTPSTPDPKANEVPKGKPIFSRSEYNKLHSWAHSHALKHSKAFTEWLGLKAGDPRAYKFLVNSIIEAAHHTRRTGMGAATIGIGKTGKRLKIHIPRRSWTDVNLGGKEYKVPKKKLSRRDIIRMGRAPGDEVSAIAAQQGKHGGGHEANNQSDMVLADKLADHDDPLETVVRRDLSYRGGTTHPFGENIVNHINQLGGSTSGDLEQGEPEVYAQLPNGAGYITTVPYGRDSQGSGLAYHVRWDTPGYGGIYAAAMTPNETAHLLNQHGVPHNIKQPEKLSRYECRRITYRSISHPSSKP